MSAATAPALRAALDRLAALDAPAAVEPEGFPLLEAAGLACPRFFTISTADDVDDRAVRALSGDRVVVKVASSTLLHRSDVGGVAVVPRERPAIREAVATMAGRVPAAGPRRFTVSEFVAHHDGPGGELLASLRWTDEFGPVVTIGPGGIYAEALARHLRPGDDVAVFAAADADRNAIATRLARLPFVRAVTGGLRGQRPLTTAGALADVVLALAALGRVATPAPLRECEINPLAVTPSGLVALDVLVKTGRAVPLAPPRPLHKLASLLAPRSVAIAGVSEAMNPGHVILRNLLREGFPPEAIRIVKPNAAGIDGCRAVASLADLSPPVDLLVLAVAAKHVAPMLLETVEHQRAESVIVIPGGLEEKAGGASALAPVRAALERARATSWGGPLINGGNCLGVRSLPGRYDTLFIPPHKMPPRPGPISPVALVTQSGAFAVARAGKLGALNPKYLVTVGNQMDLTVGDYLAWLADDESIRVFGVYVEGFRPADGLQLVRAARRITESGRIVILYRAGRTPAGAAATASHTASMAGDYVATRELAEAAGAVLVESLEAFEDAVRVAAALDARRPRGRRLGAVSNAGFECVAIADALGPLSLAPLSNSTAQRLHALLAAARIDGLVDVHNPLDLTPMADDETFAEAVRALLGDPAVDIGLVGCVPLTPALETLPPAAAHAEDAAREGAVASRLVRLWRESDTPWVAVVDAGAQYDPMVGVLESGGVVTFRTADRALRAIGLFLRALAPGSTE
jgi:acyl-CoA synthetase (NDP forming)